MHIAKRAHSPSGSEDHLDHRRRNILACFLTAALGRDAERDTPEACGPWGKGGKLGTGCPARHSGRPGSFSDWDDFRLAMIYDTSLAGIAPPACASSFKVVGWRDLYVMELLEPLIFEPLYMERVWGGRRLESVFGRKLPTGAVIGESWELVDRLEAQSVVHNGPLRGKMLHELWTDHRAELFGGVRDSERFPLLVKILDCQEVLSVQVHPPAQTAKLLKGEPKSEMWYVARAEPDAEIFAGLQNGVTKERFLHALEAGSVADLLHRIPTQEDFFISIPSGRLHAIGRGNLIFEIQQNSDTTYRVFDWNRTGLDGKPRALHIDESLQSILWDDFEPAPGAPAGERLVEDSLFQVNRLEIDAPRDALTAVDAFGVFGVLRGSVRVGTATFGPGAFFVVPHCATNLRIEPENGTPARLIKTTLPVAC